MNGLRRKNHQREFHRTQNRYWIRLAILIAALLALVIFEVPIADAELRVFQLKISNAESGTDRTIISRLDDQQYAGYFPLKKSESISIERTWMCYERSDHTGALCAPPAENPDRNLASPPR